jgi:outer membrane protein
MHEQASNERRTGTTHLTGWVRLALTAALCLAWTSSLTADGNVRIGYVDMKHLFDNAPQVIAAREALDQEFRPRNEALLADEARLDRMHQNLTNAREADAEARFDMEREIRNLQRSIDRRREDLSEELRFRTNTEKKALEETIEVAVRQVAERGGFDLILTSPVAYAAPSINVTDQILEWLEIDFRNQSAGNRR